MNTQPWVKFYPPNALDDLEVEGKRLTHLLEKAKDRYAELPALKSPTATWSYAHLDAEARKLALSFETLGIKACDRVAIYLPNQPEYVAALFATWLIGATVVQVNPAYVACEVQRILEHAGASLLITNADQLARLVESGGTVQCALCIMHEGTVPEFRGEINPQAGPWPDASSDVAVLQYTGGTTGLPKAVMLTHKNILSNIEQRMRLTFRVLNVMPGAKVVNTLPMCHVFGLTCVTLMGLSVGMTQLIVPRFHARPVLELIRNERPFAFFGVPTMYTAFLREADLEDFGLNQIKVFNSSGAPMPIAHQTQFESRVGVRVLDGFGMSEASPSTHTNPPQSPRRSGSSGLPLPFTEVRILEVGGELIDVAPSETGELAIRGPQVMRGYWNDPELTEQTLRDGWLLTGDLARTDEDGYLFVIGRLKEIIVASGYNVYPAEIERVIAQIPGIAEVAVIGIPDNYRGETVKAIIALHSGYEVKQETIISHCRSELAAFKIPTVVEFMKSLPRTAVGKIDKRQLINTNQAERGI